MKRNKIKDDDTKLSVNGKVQRSLSYMSTTPVPLHRLHLSLMSQPKKPSLLFNFYKKINAVMFNNCFKKVMMINSLVFSYDEFPNIFFLNSAHIVSSFN